MEKCCNFVSRYVNFGEIPGRSTSRGISFKPIIQTCLQINQISFKCCSVDGINLGEKYGVIFKRPVHLHVPLYKPSNLVSC